MSEKNYNPAVEGGYWLLSIRGLFQDFVNDETKRTDIVGLIPRQYTNNNFITAYQQSSIDWINLGEDFLLTEIKIEILDPITKEVVSTLGANNAIYLELIQGTKDSIKR